MLVTVFTDLLPYICVPSTYLLDPHTYVSTNLCIHHTYVLLVYVITYPHTEAACSASQVGYKHEWGKDLNLDQRILERQRKARQVSMVCSYVIMLDSYRVSAMLMFSVRLFSRHDVCTGGWGERAVVRALGALCACIVRSCALCAKFTFVGV